jgi:hypothetical protein
MLETDSSVDLVGVGWGAIVWLVYSESTENKIVLCRTLPQKSRIVEQIFYNLPDLSQILGLLANKTVKCKRFLFQNTACYCQSAVVFAKYLDVFMFCK